MTHENALTPEQRAEIESRRLSVKDLDTPSGRWSTTLWKVIDNDVPDLLRERDTAHGLVEELVGELPAHSDARCEFGYWKNTGQLCTACQARNKAKEFLRATGRIA